MISDKTGKFKIPEDKLEKSHDESIGLEKAVKEFRHEHPELKSFDRHIKHCTKYPAVNYQWVYIPSRLGFSISCLGKVFYWNWLFKFGNKLHWKFLNVGEILVSKEIMDKLIT